MRSARRLLLVAVSGLALSVGAFSAPSLAQTAAAATSPAQTSPSDPWAQTASDVPVDPAVRFGLLPNGMRYAILRNATPPGQASLRLRIDAGSLMERDDQKGLAHFMEHMAFNGSDDIPENELIRTLERLGLSFGADTNASTSFDETVYKLDLPRTDEETVETSLNILREMSDKATLAADAIDRERGVVLSEERTRDGPAMRAIRARLAFMMRGQLVPDRFPIGDTSVLQNAPRDLFAQFYDTWYRPSRATLVAVGDFDVDQMETRIRNAFGDWRNDGPDGAEPNLGEVQTRAAEAEVFVEPGVQSAVQVAWVSPPDLTPDTLDKQYRELVRYIGLQVLNRRFQSIARGDAPPFISAAVSRSTDLRSIDSASLYANFQPGAWQPALAAIEQEQRRLVEHGVTAAELNREIAEFRTALQNAVAGAATRRTPALANGLANTVNEDVVFTSPQTDLAIFESVVDGLTPVEVNAALKTAFDGSGPLVFVTSPTAIDGGAEAVMAALTASQAQAVAAPAAQTAAEWPYADFGAPGAVADKREIVDLNTTFVTFANGTRLTIKPTAFRDDQVMVSIRGGDGFLSLPNDRPTAIWAAGSEMTEGGLGRLTAEQLEQTLASNVYGASFSPGEDSWMFSGVTRPQDLGLQLQVLTAYLTDAAWRPEPFERMRGLYTQALPQIDATPGGVFSRDSDALLRSGDARWRFPSAQDLAAADLNALRQTVEGNLSRGPLEVVVVGDVNVDEVIARVAATVGALPTRPAAEPAPEGNTRIRFPDGVAEPVRLEHGGRLDQALGFVAWPTVDSFSNPREMRTVRLLADVMRLRLTEELRENQGVTYSPQVGDDPSTSFEGYGYLSAAIEAPPERLAGFFADVDRIASDLAANPVSADELERARRPRVEAIYRAQNTNEFWMSELQDAQTDPGRLPALRSAVADLERATPADLQRVAREYLVASKAYRLQVMPRVAAR